MNDHVDHFEELSQSWRAFILIMQKMNFGRFENILFEHGEPVVEDSGFNTVTEIKFGGENGPREEAMLTAYRLKKPLIELIDTLDSVGDGMIRCLVIKNGLPFKLELEN